MPSTPTPPPDANANSYSDLATANTYLDDSVRAGAWEFLDDDTKSRALITATRLIDKQCLVGEQTDPDQPLHFPATGVVDKEGDEVPDNEVPLGVVYATIELAYGLSQNEALETSANTGSNTKRLRAGSAEIEKFRPGSASGSAGVKRFPTIVQEYLAPFLKKIGANGAAAYGSDQTSQFDNCDTYGRTEGYA